MKKLIIPLFTFLICNSKVNAQQARAHLDINNVNATILNCGDMFWNPDTSGLTGYEFPKGSGKNSMSTSGIWIAGTDASTNVLKVAAQTYRQTGNDYWAGPIDLNNPMDSISSSHWDRIWKVNKTDIDLFNLFSIHTLSNTPNSILIWPGKGNTHAIDNIGNPLVVFKDMAPFVDLNNDGVYNALDGDYPQIKGEQALWWVFNDQKAHGESGGAPLNVEVKVMAYACNSVPELQNVTYYNYSITNYANTNYTNSRIGFFCDGDLGYAFDDYIGFDSTRRMGIYYNASASDPGVNGYGSNLTQTGVIILKTPNDNLSSKAPLGSFTFYNNNQSGQNGNPLVTDDYVDYMNARWQDGRPFTKSCNGRDTNAAPTNYVFPDEPNNTLGWSEKNCNNVADDRRFIMSTNDFTFPTTTTLDFEMAVVNTPTGSSNADFSVIKSMADYVITHPDACSSLAPTSVSSVSLENGTHVFPNPSSTTISVSWEASDVQEVSLLNTLGQTIETKKADPRNMITFNSKHLQSGIYFIQIKTASAIATKKILKQ